MVQKKMHTMGKTEKYLKARRWGRNKERTMVQKKITRYSNLQIKKEGALDGPLMKIISTQSR